MDRNSRFTFVRFGDLKMTEEVKTNEVSSILDEIKDTVKDTIKEHASSTIEHMIESIKEKLTANGIEFTEQIQNLVKEAITAIMTETGESVSNKVSDFMDSKKDQWTALAAENPDEARRKLRTFWGGIAACCAVIGFAIGAWVF